MRRVLRSRAPCGGAGVWRSNSAGRLGARTEEGAGEASHRGLPIEIVPATRSHHNGGLADAGFPQEEGQLGARSHANWCAADQADALVSAGNTGAVMAVARFGLGTLSSVDRAALAAPFPTSRGGDGRVARRGRECGFQARAPGAVRGDGRNLLPGNFRNAPAAEWRCYRSARKKSKGNELTREAYSRLKLSPFNFTGNVEGRDIFNGSVDVIVCDGFIGNIALKISEGVAQHIAA